MNIAKLLRVAFSKHILFRNFKTFSYWQAQSYVSIYKLGQDTNKAQAFFAKHFINPFSGSVILVHYVKYIKYIHCVDASKEPF